MTDSFDFITACRPAMILRTRDHGEDLVAPGVEGSPRRRTASPNDALDPGNRLFCCD